MKTGSTLRSSGKALAISAAILLLLFPFSPSLSAQSFNEVIKLTTAQREDDDGMGTSVAISGDYAIVGIPGEDDAPSGPDLSNAGSAIIYERDGNGNWQEVQVLTASDREANDEFGFSVAIAGNYAIVGAPQEDEDANGNNSLSNSGSAYVFERNANGSWSQVEKIVSNGRFAEDEFGFSVAIESDGVAVVGAPEANDTPSGTLDNGAVYVFLRNGSGSWNFSQALTAFDRAEDDQFGWSVAIDNSLIVVGAIGEDEDNNTLNTLSNAGSVYVFRDLLGLNSWTTGQKLVSGDREAGDLFGSSVAIDGNRLVVGASGEDDDENGSNNLESAGSAYVFERSLGIWSQQDKIVSSDRAQGDNFGFSVGISGDLIVVGAYLEDQNENGQIFRTSAGSAYLFERDGSGDWSQIQKIVSSDRTERDNFGYAVGISGTYVISGARQEDDNDNSLSDAGAAYIFERNLAPVPVCQDLTIGVNDNCEDVLSVEPEDFDNGTTDPNGDDLTLSLDMSGPFPLGTTNLVLTFDDGELTASCNVTLTVVDDTPPMLSSVETLFFQNGTENAGGVYDAAEDTYVEIAAPNEINDERTFLVIDNDAADHAAIQFKNIIGTSAGRVPTGVTVTSAVLSFYVPAGVSGGDDFEISRILGTWDAATTNWNNFTLNGNIEGGIQQDGIEATPTLYTISPLVGLKTIDVTEDVQAWVNGLDNNGWAIFNPSSNAANIFPSEVNVVDLRPSLTISYLPTEDGTDLCSDFTVSADVGTCSYTVVGDEFDPVAFDNCALLLTGNDYNSSPSLAGAVFPVGTTNVIYAALDESDNTGTCNFTITVEDREAPFIGEDLSETLQFQNGLSNAGGVYEGTDDTYIREGVLNGNSNFGTSTEVTIDNSPLSQGLLQFTDIFGTDAGQIPPGSTITSATLTLDVFNIGGAGIEMSRVLGAWEESSVTWNNFTLNGNTEAGAQQDEVEATNTLRIISPLLGVRQIDVTEDVQVWSDAGDNNGWVFFNSSTNGLDFTSSESSTTDARPVLSVTYLLPEDTNPCVSFTRTINTDDCTYAVDGTEFDPPVSDNCGVVLAENDFNSDMSLAGEELPLGVTTVTFTIEDEAGNTDACTFEIEVLAPVTGFTITSGSTFCENDPPSVVTTSVSEPSGIFSGPGVTDNGNGEDFTFDPSAAGPGTITISYNFNDPTTTCPSVATAEIEVLELPEVSFTAPDDLCIDAGIQQNLLGGSPFGGMYSGLGVSDNGDGTFDFDPAAAGVGIQTIAYSFTGVGAPVQLGEDLPAQGSGDVYGSSVALSADGNRVAFGGFLNDDGGNDAGHVQVFDWDGTNWIQAGIDLDGTSSADLFGFAIALSDDGNTLAVGAPGPQGQLFVPDGTGFVRVYSWNGTAWLPLGQDLTGDMIGDRAGKSVALSADGTRMAFAAAGAPGIGSDNEFVRVFEYNGSAWIQVGSDILGAADNDALGDGLDLSSDGNRLAIGSSRHGNDRGRTQIFDWNGTTWVQLGADIAGAADDDFSGDQVAISANGDRVVISATRNTDNGNNSGQVRVFDWNGTAWVQAGQDIDGDGTNSQAGSDVAISATGNRIAVGSLDDNGGLSGAGKVRIYDWDGTDWIPLADDIDGQTSAENFGSALALSNSGERLAVGAPLFNVTDGVGRVYDIEPELCTDTVTDEVEVLDAASEFCNDPPIAICQSVEVDLTDADPCLANLAADTFDNGSFDPEDNPLTFSIVPAGPFLPGETQLLFIVSDGTLSDTCETSIIATDNTPPVFVDCPEDLTTSTDPGACFATYSFDLPTIADDPCNDPTVDLSLEATLARYNSRIDRLTSVITNQWVLGADDIEVNNIDDPFPDAYEVGNEMNTDLASAILYSEGEITSSNDFGVGSAYFTQYNQGVWMMAADINQLSFYEITGTLSADGDGVVYTFDNTYTAPDGTTYYAFFKGVTEGRNDPSINHVIIVPNTTGITQTVSDDTGDDLHRVDGLAGASRIYQFNWYGRIDDNLSYAYYDQEINQIIQAFIANVVHPQAYVVQTLGSESGERIGLGENEFSFTAFDIAGNTSTCAYTVTVADTEAPIADCLTDTTIYVSADDCEAVFEFDPPSFSDNCLLDSAANILFVSDNSNETEIPAQLMDAGYNVTVVTNDYVDDATQDNVVLQGDLSYYGIIYWHAVGEGSGSVHNAATIDNLEAYVQAGGNLFITGVDVVVSPQDPLLEVLIGGRGSNDAPNDNNEVYTILGPANALNSGQFDIIGLEPADVNDDDAITSLSAETVTVFDSDLGARWTLRTTPGGLVAFISTGQIGLLSFDSWETPGSGYYEALRNFAFNITQANQPIAAVQTAGPASGEAFAVGQNVVTFAGTDVAGNTGTCSFTVEVLDTIAPVLTNCPDNIIQNNDPGVCGAIVSYTAPTATDNCPSPGTTNITFLLLTDDFGGETAYEIFDVNSGELVASNGPFAYASNSNFEEQIALPNGDYRFVISDLFGDGICCLEGDGNYSLVVEGNTINSSSGGSFGDSEEILFSISTAPIDPDAVQTAGLPSGSEFPIGTTTNTFVFTDASGNTASCSFDVTINDTEAPTVTSCPGDISVPTDPDLCAAAVTYTLPTAADNCSRNGPTGFVDVNITFDNFPSETSFEIIDLINATTVVSSGFFLDPNNAGTTTTESFLLPPGSYEFIISDGFGDGICCGFGNGNYNIVVDGDTIVSPSGGNFGDEETIAFDIVPEDFSVEAVQTAGLASGATYPIGTTTNTFAFTDDAGNIAYCTFNVTVTDESQPTIFNPADGSNCAADLLVELEEDGTLVIPNLIADLEALDNCVATLSQSPDAGTEILNLAPGTTQQVTITATDDAGNTNTESCIVTITAGEPTLSITDPCSCKNNATTSENGQFDELIEVILTPAGETWTVTAVDGLFQTTSPAPPAAPLPIAVGTQLAEVPTATPGQSNYELAGIHVDGLGYSLTVS
ncbi:MAG: HYR domain-containing protein, partial [Bacteroidota bacterium]